MNLRCTEYKKWFLNYVSEYGEEPPIILKRDHSIRVASLQKNLYKTLFDLEEYQLLAEFIGLFHDFGRFEQWRQYKNFLDYKTVDHADFSVQQLFNNGIIRKVLDNNYYDDIIYDSIKYHNKQYLPNELCVKDETLFYTNLSINELKNIQQKYQAIKSLYAMTIRDMDKLDILKQYFTNRDILTVDYLPVSDKVAADFYANKAISITDRKTKNDSVVLRLAFINDMNLTWSLKFIQDENIIEKIRSIYPCVNNITDFFDYSSKRVEELINKNKDTQFILKK